MGTGGSIRGGDVSLSTGYIFMAWTLSLAFKMYIEETGWGRCGLDYSGSG